jgi:hypothetical protein
VYNMTVVVNYKKLLATFLEKVGPKHNNWTHCAYA